MVFTSRLCLSVSFVIWIGLISSALAKNEILDRILAIVSGHIIMQSDVRAFIDLQLIDVPLDVRSESDVLNYLIERRLVIEEVDRYVVSDLPETNTDTHFLEIRERFSSEEAFAIVLQKVGFTNDDIRQVLKDNERSKAYLNDRFSAVNLLTEDQLRKYYQENVDEFTEEDFILSFDQVKSLVQQRLAMELHAEMISEWVASLVRQAQIIYLP